MTATTNTNTTEGWEDFSARMLAKYGIGWASEAHWGEPHNRQALLPEELATLERFEAESEKAYDEYLDSRD